MEGRFLLLNPGHQLNVPVLLGFAALELAYLESHAIVQQMRWP
jgi:hypothetical protein